MNRQFSRVAFGSEKKLFSTLSDKCPSCGALLGQYHAAVCEREGCCQCHHALITCRCWVLEQVWQLRMAVEMSSQFSCLGDALINSLKKKDIQRENMNLLEQAAIFRLVFEQIDILNPTFKPVAFDGGGKKVFAEGELAKALALSPQELDEVMQIRFQQQRSPSQTWC